MSHKEHRTWIFLEEEKKFLKKRDSTEPQDSRILIEVKTLRAIGL